MIAFFVDDFGADIVESVGEFSFGVGNGVSVVGVETEAVVSLGDEMYLGNGGAAEHDFVVDDAKILNYRSARGVIGAFTKGIHDGGEGQLDGLDHGPAHEDVAAEMGVVNGEGRGDDAGVEQVVPVDGTEAFTDAGAGGIVHFDGDAVGVVEGHYLVDSVSAPVGMADDDFSAGLVDEFDGGFGVGVVW